MIVIIKTIVESLSSNKVTSTTKQSTHPWPPLYSKAGRAELDNSEYRHRLTQHRHNKAAVYLHWNKEQRAEFKHKREMVRAWTLNGNRKWRHHNLEGYAITDRSWDRGQQTRRFNQEQTGKKRPSHWYVYPTRRTLQFKLAVTEKLSKYRDPEIELKNGQSFFVCFSWMPNFNCFGAAVGA